MTALAPAPLARDCAGVGPAEAPRRGRPPGRSAGRCRCGGPRTCPRTTSCRRCRSRATQSRRGAARRRWPGPRSWCADVGRWSTSRCRAACAGRSRPRSPGCRRRRSRSCSGSRSVSSTIRVGPVRDSVDRVAHPVTWISGDREAACVVSPAYDARQLVAPSGRAAPRTTRPAESVVPERTVVQRRCTSLKVDPGAGEWCAALVGEGRGEGRLQPGLAGGRSAQREVGDRQRVRGADRPGGHEHSGERQDDGRDEGAHPVCGDVHRSLRVGTPTVLAPDANRTHPVP